MTTSRSEKKLKQLEKEKKVDANARVMSTFFLLCRIEQSNETPLINDTIEYDSLLHFKGKQRKKEKKLHMKQIAGLLRKKIDRR